MPHSLKVVTDICDLYEYVALRHCVMLQGYDTQVFLPNDGTYDPVTRTGSVYNYKDAEYVYNEKPSFIARIAYLDPQPKPNVRGPDMLVDYENTAYTLKNNATYCPGEIVRFSKLLVNYGQQQLSYFVKSVDVLRNPNASDASAEAMVELTLTIHV